MKPYLVIFLLCSGAVYAQDTTQQFLTESFGKSYRFLANDVISQPLLKMDQYALVEGGYRYTSGNYMQAQDAPTQRDLFFYTEGTKRIRKFLVSGSFSYQYIKQDSVAYTLRYALNDPAPYYFFAAAKGNWDIGKYRLQGTISHTLLNDKLTIGAGATYEAGNAWRSNDPRPEYFFYDIQARGTVQYNIFPRHRLGVAAGIISKNTNDEIEYRNENYEKSELYAAYKTYLQYGYGFAQLISGARFIRNKANGYVLEGLYDGQFNQLQLTAKGGYTYRESNFTRRADVATPEQAVGSFYEDIINADLLAQYRQGNNRWSANAHYLYHLGKDKHVILNGNNYVYAFDQLRIEPLYARMAKDRVQYELGAQLSVSNLFKADGAQGQKINYQYAGAGLTGAYYHYLPAGNRFWKALLRVDAQLPLDPQLTTSVQQTDFVKGVIYYDYYYYNATAVTTTAEYLYRFPVQKTNAFFKLSGQYQQAVIKKDNNYAALTKPGGNRWYIQGSIGISL
jgi:hypothetical protein